jgi:hypothetical protein
LGIKLPSISLSKYTVLFAAQFIVNVSLALWLYNEYLHNPFMQSYISSAWSAIWPEVTIAIGIVVGAVATLIAYDRGHLYRFLVDTDPGAPTQGVGTAENLATIDVCPFCDVPLKTISEGRLQCRNCRRYFKSNLPKVSA